MTWIETCRFKVVEGRMSSEAELIEIEKELRRSDPGFVRSWERQASGPRDLVAFAVSGCLVATAAMLLGFGLLTVDRGLVQGAGMVVLCLPVGWLVAAARRFTKPARTHHP
ncbi:DUF3040 domain-containing protein [Pseudonocardia alni]|uniref:DUF3040 domain-containing protein n=1 Tax=Pseudonocardia alni TaxID=33907 RepID=UPI0024784542|nr:DUF3040 domain-containing protein [Pseudonocardia alni]WFG47359.1 DUF3040 domain-containing protein [Pseudonocardia alni]